MAIYPLEFYRRAEEKWRRRSESLRDAVTGSPSKKEGDDTLVRWPWLLAIGQGLQSQIAELESAQSTFVDGHSRKPMKIRDRDSTNWNWR